MTSSPAAPARTMTLGMVGLGRMGAGMSERLRRAGHDVVGYDHNPEVSDVASLAELVGRLPAPAHGLADGARPAT